MLDLNVDGSFMYLIQLNVSIFLNQHLTKARLICCLVFTIKYRERENYFTLKLGKYKVVRSLNKEKEMS